MTALEQAAIHFAAADYRSADAVLERAAHTANVLTFRAHVQRALAHYGEAERLAREALTLAVEDGVEAVGALNALAVTYKYWGRFSDAEPLLRRALDIAERQCEASDVASLYHNLGGLAHARGDYAAAEAPARRAVEIRRQALGGDHVETAADEAALAAILDGLGRVDEAETLLRRALRVFERVHGPDHYEVAVTCNNLAAIAHRRGDAATAEPLYLRALAIKERLLGDDHPDVAVTLTNLGTLYGQQKRAQEATEVLRRAVAILDGVVAPDHPTLTICREQLELRAREITEPDRGSTPISRPPPGHTVAACPPNPPPTPATGCSS